MRTLIFMLFGTSLLLPINRSVAQQSTGQKKMNVLFFLVDDMGWADVGYNGSTFYETPNIDALAKDALQFTRAYAACPVCSPTRAAIMTGKFPVRTGITDFINESRTAWNRNTKLLPADNQLQLNLSEVTLAETMKQAGYKTFFAGKWHLGSTGYFPTDQGFDINIGGGEAGNPGSYFAPYKRVKLAAPEGEYLPERLSDETTAFIKSNKDKPFFIYHSFYLVHTPLQAQEKLIEKYKRKRDSLGLNDDEEVMGYDVYHKMQERKVRSVQSHVQYAAMVEALDNAVGKIIQALKQQGLYENTLIVFTSDNGGLSTNEGSPTSNFPLRGGKGYMYEGGIRVPLLIRYPGVTAPGTSTDMVAHSIDYYATIANATGAKIPTQQQMDGINLFPGKKLQTMERELYWHYPHYGNQGGGPASCIMDGDWKLIYWYDREAYELFDIKNDPYEKREARNEYKDKFTLLQTKLQHWLTNAGALFPTPNPKFKSN